MTTGNRSASKAGAGDKSQQVAHKGGWRYQPVVMANDGAILLCEVHIDADGALRSWTDPGVYPVGDGDDAIHELTGDLCHMLLDAYSWVPEPYESLKPGMQFTRAITMEQRRALADFTDRIALNCEAARS